MPFQEWPDAMGRAHELTLRIQQFESLPLSDRRSRALRRAAARWRFGPRASRTLMRSTRRTFFHDQPLIQRREIHQQGIVVAADSNSKLSPREGERISIRARNVGRSLSNLTVSSGGATRAQSRTGLRHRGSEIAPPETSLLRAYRSFGSQTACRPLTWDFNL